jgi:hypothetical protein
MPDVRNFTTKSALVAGRPYRFYVEAINYVGVGPASPFTTIYACDDVGPVRPPELNGQQSASLIPLKWFQPENNGGCPITSYAILRNGGPHSPEYV